MNIEHAEPLSYCQNQYEGTSSNLCLLTRFVALCSVQIDSSLSSRSPRLYGKELPLAIAEATADLRKSIEH
jgi:hypothetical protein